MHIAVVYQHEKLANVLAEKGADLELKDKDGYTAVDLAPRNWSFGKGISCFIYLKF